MYACYIHICIYIPTGESVGVVHVCSEEEVERVGGDGHAEKGLPREYVYMYMCIYMYAWYAHIYIYVCKLTGEPVGVVHVRSEEERLNV